MNTPTCGWLRSLYFWFSRLIFWLTEKQNKLNVLTVHFCYLHKCHFRDLLAIIRIYGPARGNSSQLTWRFFSKAQISWLSISSLHVIFPWRQKKFINLVPWHKNVKFFFLHKDLWEGQSRKWKVTYEAMMYIILT